MAAGTTGEATSPEILENHPASEIRLGDSASLERTVTQHDIRLFAAVTGDVNPAHVDALYASGSFFHEIIAHGMLGGAWISSVLGTQFPGPGTIYLGQTLQFLKPVHIGDTLTVTVTVSAIDGAKGHVTLGTQCVNQRAEIVIDGEARVLAPREKLRIARTELAQPLLADKNLHYDQLLTAAKACPRIRMGVVHPCSRLAGYRDRRRGQYARCHVNQPAWQPGLCLGHTHQRGVDDRAACAFGFEPGDRLTGARCLLSRQGPRP